MEHGCQFIVRSPDAVCVCHILDLIELTADTIIHGKVNRSTFRIASAKVPAILTELHTHSPFGGWGSGIQWVTNPFP
jgi:hypothetical protein